MPLIVYMRDMLEPQVIDQDFTETMQALNMAAAKGHQFLVMESPTGHHVGVNIPNINYFEEED